MHGTNLARAPFFVHLFLLVLLRFVVQSAVGPLRRVCATPHRLTALLFGSCGADYKKRFFVIKGNVMFYWKDEVDCDRQVSP